MALYMNSDINSSPERDYKFITQLHVLCSLKQLVQCSQVINQMDQQCVLLLHLILYRKVGRF